MVVLAVLAVALIVALHLPPVQQRLVRYAVSKLQQSLGANIDYEAVHFNLATRTFDLRGLRFGVPGATPLVAAGHVHVHYPWTAYRGSLTGLDVTLEDADVALIHQGGRWTTMPAKWFGGKPSPTPKPLPAFSVLRLRNVNVRYADLDAHFEAMTRGIRVDMTPTGPDHPHELAGPVTPGATSHISWGPRVTTMRVEGGRGKYSPTAAGVDALKLSAAEGDISTDVDFRFHGDNRLHLHAGGTLRGEALQTWLPILETLQGPLALDFTMPAAGGAPAFADVRVSGRDLSWRALPLQRFSAGGALDSGGISLADVQIGVAGGRAHGSGRLAWAEAGVSQAALTWDRVDAGTVWRTLLAGSGAVWVAPASLVSGRFDGRWTAWHAAALDGRVTTSWRPRPSGPTRAEHIWLDGRIDARFAHGPWTIDVAARADGALDLDGIVRTRGSLADYGDWPLGGQLALAGASPAVFRDAMRLTRLDLARYLRDADGRFTGEADLSRTFGTAQAAIAFDAGIRWPNQPAVQMHGRTTVNPSALTVEHWQATSGPSSATAEVRLDFNRDTVQGTFSGSQLPIEAWTRRFDLGRPATGTVSVGGRLSGPLGSPTIAAQIQGGPVDAEGQRFTAVSGGVEYHAGQLRASDLTLESAAGGTLAVQGSWDTKSGNIDATIGARALQVRTVVPGIMAPSGEPAGSVAAAVSGLVHVTGATMQPRVEGSLDAPSLTLDGRDLGALHVRATTEDDRLQLAASAPVLGASLDGTIELSGDRPYTVTASVHTPDSPLAATIRGAAVNLGAIDLTGHAAGTLSAAPITAADLQIDRFDGTVLGLALTVHTGARVGWQPNRLTVSGLDVSAGGTHLTVAGTLDGQPGHRIGARLTGKLEDLRPAVLSALPDAYDTAVAAGPFTATLTASGALDRPVVAGSFALEGAELGDGSHPPATGVRVRGTLDASTLTLEVAEAHWQGAHLALSGTVPAWFLGLPSAPHTGRASLTGHLDDVTIAALEPFVNSDNLTATNFTLAVQYLAPRRSPRARGRRRRRADHRGVTDRQGSGTRPAGARPSQSRPPAPHAGPLDDCRARRRRHEAHALRHGRLVGHPEPECQGRWNDRPPRAHAALQQLPPGRHRDDQRLDPGPGIGAQRERVRAAGTRGAHGQGPAAGVQRRPRGGTVRGRPADRG